MSTAKLKLSADRKVTMLCNPSGGAAVQNTYGHLAGVSCVGRTPFCDGCYAATLENLRSNVGRAMAHNWSLISECGSNVARMADLIRPAVAEYRKQLANARRRTGTDLPDVFRIHWDGDFHNRAYAVAWRTVILETPDTHFWFYTRTFDIVDVFANVPNVTVYLSVDEYNVAEAMDTAAANPFVKFAFCAETWDDAEILARKVSGRNAPKCPELTGKVPLGGACVKCGLCIYGRNNVRFATQH